MLPVYQLKSKFKIHYVIEWIVFRILSFPFGVSLCFRLVVFRLVVF